MRKVVLNCPGGLSRPLDGLVEQFLRDGVTYVGVVGVDCTRIEDLIDELAVGDGSGDRFLLTASHPGKTVVDAVHFARSLTGDYTGDEVQVIEL